MTSKLSSSTFCSIFVVNMEVSKLSLLKNLRAPLQCLTICLANLES